MSEGGQNLSSSHSVSSNTHVTNELHNLNGVSNYSPFQARRVTNRATPSVGGENPDPTPTDSFSAPKNQNNNNNNNNVNSDDADELNASACMASSLSSSPSVQSSASSTSSDTSQPKSISCIESETVDSESNADFYFESKEENESCIFTPVSVQTLDINDFECSLCYKLFYQPVTTVCGHTYCKSCLLSSLQYSPYCPLCRNKLFDHPQDFNYSINFVLANIIEKNFPLEYKQREEEEKKMQLKICVQEQTKSVNADLNVERRRGTNAGRMWWGCVLLYPCDM